jgi:hypothetical protein
MSRRCVAWGTSEDFIILELTFFQRRQEKHDVRQRNQQFRHGDGPVAQARQQDSEGRGHRRRPGKRFDRRTDLTAAPKPLPMISTSYCRSVSMRPLPGGRSAFFCGIRVLQGGYFISEINGYFLSPTIIYNG